MSLKKLLIVVVFVFVGFWLFTDPQGLASAARGAGGQVWELATSLFSSVIDFVSALT